MAGTIEINNRKIGENFPPYIICELSGNHNGSLDRALKLVDAAAATGCDAIKLQTYSADTLTINCNKSDFKIKSGLWAGYTLYDLYREAATPYEWHEPIFSRAREKGVTIFSTPFDETAVDLLVDLDTPAFKVASFEITDIPLIEYIAKQGRPMILSTGLASLSEIELAVYTARNAGCENLAVLHCISSYPAPTNQANIRTIPHLGQAFNVVTGLSDHTHGSAVSVASVALGASVIEKHFTLSRTDGGPDADFSLEPDEFEDLVANCKDAWTALGKIDYSVKKSEKQNLIFRRSLYAVKDIKAGEKFTKENIRSIRPGFGMNPSQLPQVLGSESSVDIVRGERLDWSMISG